MPAHICEFPTPPAPPCVPFAGTLMAALALEAAIDALIAVHVRTGVVASAKVEPVLRQRYRRHLERLLTDIAIDTNLIDGAGRRIEEATAGGNASAVAAAQCAHNELVRSIERVEQERGDR